jgi:hypothetical protein
MAKARAKSVCTMICPSGLIPTTHGLIKRNKDRNKGHRAYERLKDLEARTKAQIEPTVGPSELIPEGYRRIFE